MKKYHLEENILWKVQASALKAISHDSENEWCNREGKNTLHNALPNARPHCSALLKSVKRNRVTSLYTQKDCHMLWELHARMAACCKMGEMPWNNSEDDKNVFNTGLFSSTLKGREVSLVSISSISGDSRHFVYFTKKKKKKQPWHVLVTTSFTGKLNDHLCRR